MKTYGQLQTETLRLCGTTSSDTTVATIVKGFIQDTVKYMRSQLGNYTTVRTRTTTTVADQQYYYKPPGLIQVESIFVTIDSEDYPLIKVSSQDAWDRMNSISVEPNTFPTHFYMRKDDFGIYPTPQTAGYTITVNYSFHEKPMTASDYTTGTVTVTENDATVTGSGTTFTSAMVGRIFSITDGTNETDYFYRIASVDSATSLELETVWESSTAAGQTYIIGASPDLPEEAHELVPFRAAGMYFGGIAEDSSKQGPRLMNFFYTGDFNNPNRTGGNIKGGFVSLQRKYSSRSNSAIIIPNRTPHVSNMDRVWGVTLS